MKSTILATAALTALVFTMTAQAADTPAVKPQAPKPLWINNYAKAMEQAKVEKKIVLLDFTGSDWCGWCIRLRNEVFSTTTFKAFAAKNLVCVELDFPRRKQLSLEVRQQNQKLQRQFGIRGYPTIIVLDSDGRKLGQMGYMAGGPNAWLGQLKRIMAKRSSAAVD